MESEFERRIREEYFGPSPDFDPPPVHKTLARKKLAVAVTHQNDPLLVIASFLNMRVKLYHAVIAFLIIWMAVLLFGESGKQVPTEQAAYTGASHLAAVNGGTVPACIKTFIER